MCKGRTLNSFSKLVQTKSMIQLVSPGFFIYPYLVLSANCSAFLVQCFCHSHAETNANFNKIFVFSLDQTGMIIHRVFSPLFPDHGRDFLKKIGTVMKMIKIFIVEDGDIHIFALSLFLHIELFTKVLYQYKKQYYAY